MQWKLAAIAAALVLLPTSLFAQTADDAVAEALACNAVRGSKAKLRCYEAAMPALQATHPEATRLASQRADAARETAAKQAKADFGLDRQPSDEKASKFERDSFGEDSLAKTSKDDGDELDSVAGVAVEIGRNNSGKLFVVLENGQIWRQTAGDRGNPYIPKKPEGLPVEISKGAFGSYFVKVQGSRGAFRAERIK